MQGRECPNVPYVPTPPTGPKRCSSMTVAVLQAPGVGSATCGETERPALPEQLAPEPAGGAT